SGTGDSRREDGSSNAASLHQPHGLTGVQAPHCPCSHLPCSHLEAHPDCAPCPWHRLYACDRGLSESYVLPLSPSLVTRWQSVWPVLPGRVRGQLAVGRAALRADGRPIYDARRSTSSRPWTPAASGAAPATRRTD